MPLISIVVPIYKVENYIEECINSILNQKFEDFELILVDDGSPDKAGEICDFYAEKDNRITVIHQNNKGLVKTRKIGAKSAKGEYIINVDGDDFIGEDLLNEVSIIIEKYRPDVIAYNFMYFDKQAKNGLKNRHTSDLYEGERLEVIKENLLYAKELKSLNYGGTIFSIWSKVVKKELFINAVSSIPDSITKGEDVAATSSIFMNCSSVFFLDCNQYFYRVNDNSMINTFNPKEIDNYIMLFQYLENIIEKKYMNQLYAYEMFMIKYYCVEASKKYKHFCDFKKCLKENLCDNILINIDKAKIYRPMFKDVILHYTMKKRWWILFFFLYKIKNI